MHSENAGVTKKDLKDLEEEIIHQFHVISEGVISQVKLVAEGVANVNEKLDRRSNEFESPNPGNETRSIGRNQILLC